MLAVTFDAHDPSRLARFWAGLLGRKVTDGTLMPGDDTQPGLRFVAGDTSKRGPNQVHLHLTSAQPADQQHLVETALSLGGSHLDVGQLPEEEHIVLADPEGNEFCVIEAGNNYLAGTGLLGELACDGTRAVGLFWSAALGWPLVWDQDEETAIQSPAGGTKVAWGGPPLNPRLGRNRLRFELTSADPSAEADRLITLGAARLGTDPDGSVRLADPDGNEFRVITIQGAGMRVAFGSDDENETTAAVVRALVDDGHEVVRPAADSWPGARVSGTMPTCWR